MKASLQDESGPVGMFRKWDPLSVKQGNNFHINIDRARSERKKGREGNLKIANVPLVS